MMVWALVLYFVRPLALGLYADFHTVVSSYLFGHHDGGGVGVASRNPWHNRGVHYAQTLHTQHAQPMVYNLRASWWISEFLYRKAKNKKEKKLK
jgi:hypothetical protein